MLIPSSIDIENVRGICNAECVMCPINEVKDPKMMDISIFKQIIDKLKPYKNELRTINLVGLGEPILDKHLIEKIRYAKDFFEVGLVTNAGANLDINTLSQLDYIIFSIDSLDKNEYEKIRKNLSYERTMNNIINFLEERKKQNFKTKVFVRMIETTLNKNIWVDYVAYWKFFLDFSMGDLILFFPEHNWADSKNTIEKNTLKCNYLYEHMTIDVNGNVELCCIDFNNKFIEKGLGNAIQNDPILIYNNSVFNFYRKKCDNGKIDELSPCKFCDVPIKREKRTFYNGS